MKILEKQKIISNHEEEHTKSERDLMVKVDCPFIVDIKFAFQDKQNLYILSEFMQGGDLLFHILKEKRFKNEKAKFYLMEIILAIDFLHKKKIIYRDLKPENILIDKTGHIKLTDFGLSKILSKEKQKAFTICGTPLYLAPDILTGEGYDDSVDWWSFGCLMYKILTGIDIFHFSKEETLSPKMYEVNILMPDYITNEAEDLIRKLVVTNPKKRLGYGHNGVEKIKNHSYFKDVDWEKVWNKEYEPPFIPEIKDDLDLKYFNKTLTEGSLDNFSYEDSSSQITNDFKGFNYITKSFNKEVMANERPNDDVSNLNFSH